MKSFSHANDAKKTITHASNVYQFAASQNHTRPKIKIQGPTILYELIQSVAVQLALDDSKWTVELFKITHKLLVLSSQSARFRDLKRVDKGVLCT